MHPPAFTPYNNPHYPYAPQLHLQQHHNTQDPRSIPTPSAPQPRKKIPVEQPYQITIREKSSGLQEEHVHNSNQPRLISKIQDDWDFNGGTYTDVPVSYPLSTYTTSNEHWYTGKSLRDVQNRRVSSSSVAHYATYVKPEKAYRQHSVGPPQFGFEGFAYIDPVQHCDGGNSHGIKIDPNTQNFTRHHSGSFEAEDAASGRWSPSLAAGLEPISVGSDASAVAARQAVSELFPELSAQYSTLSGQETFRSGGGAHNQKPPTYIQQRFSTVISDRSSTSSGDMSRPRIRSVLDSPDGERPRLDYPAISPESLYDFSSPNKSPAHRVASSSTFSTANINYEDFDDSEAYDETDEDDNTSIILMQDGIISACSSTSSSPSPEHLSREKCPSSESTTSTHSQNHTSKTPSLPQKSTTSASAGRRTRKPIPPISATCEKYDQNDALLVRYRQLGVSYKNIKTRLNLDEAESTLRGRYRTLTKPKNERLRKPVWSEHDIQLLLDTVDPDVPQIKWKQVSDTIVSRGGSYRFGSSTCKKQYLALVSEGRATALSEGGTGGKRRKQRAVNTRRPE